MTLGSSDKVSLCLPSFADLGSGMSSTKFLCSFLAKGESVWGAV